MDYSNYMKEKDRRKEKKATKETDKIKFKILLSSQAFSFYSTMQHQRLKMTLRYEKKYCDALHYLIWKTKIKRRGRNFSFGRIG